ncbi:uncharacterized protein LOC111108147 isoform X2 [Crassostrea virginica]
MDALYMIVACVVLILAIPGESQSFVSNNVTIQFNKTCSSNVNVSCFVYYIKGVGCSARAATAFPHLYNIPTDNKFPEKPYSMISKPFYQKWPSNKKYYPGLNITLKAPITASFDALKGFELIFTYSLDKNYGCLIFDLSAGKLTFIDAEETNFWAAIWPLGEPDPPVVLLVSRSLPPAPAEYDRFLNKTEHIGHWGNEGTCVSITECGPTITPSSEWVTTIFNQVPVNSSGPFNKIKMSFALAPPEYNFMVYTVTLYKVNASRPVASLNVTKDSPTHMFERVSPGTYIIKVLPFDSYFNFGNSFCLCKNRIGNCFPCTTTITKEFSVGYAANKVPIVDENGTPDPNTIAAVIGALLGIVLVSIVGFFFFYRRRKEDREIPKPNENYENIDGHPEKQEIGNINPVFHTYSVLEFDEGRGRELSKKTIFLAYAEDHNYHKDVVTAFAGFLKTHCRCNVIFAPWRLNEIMQDKFRWVINAMDQADYTVIVNSFTAHEQFKQWKSNGKKDSNIYQGSPLADLFIPILNQTCIRLNNNAEYRKFIMVRFDYTSKEHTISELNSGGEYILMKHLREFLCHIHKIDQHKTKMEDVELAFVDDFTQLIDGAELNKKIQRAKAHELRLPQREDSKISTDSGMHSFESVTEEEKEVIKNLYEQSMNNRFGQPPGYQGDSITEIIQHEQPSQYDEIREPQLEFHPPSVINPTDESSEILMLEIEQFNKMNTGYGTEPMDLSFIGPDQEIHLNDPYDDESCRSIGGRSV